MKLCWRKRRWFKGEKSASTRAGMKKAVADIPKQQRSQKITIDPPAAQASKRHGREARDENEIPPPLKPWSWLSKQKAINRSYAPAGLDFWLSFSMRSFCCCTSAFSSGVASVITLVSLGGAGVSRKK